uniref:Natriuretic peptide B n=1 Tax=Esox lucius TaxID=8010 RepID=A0A3P8ZS52_ESOLU
MQLYNIIYFGLLLFLNLSHLSAYPVYNGLLTNDDMDVLKVSSYYAIQLHKVFERCLVADRSCNLPFVDTDDFIETICSNLFLALQVLLHRLEESIPEQREAEQVPKEKLDDLTLEDIAMVTQDEREQPQTRLDNAAIREFLSARDLKTVRNDSSSKRYSGCFGSRMDRIGSMSSLGCNTVGKYNSKSK